MKIKMEGQKQIELITKEYEKKLKKLQNKIDIKTQELAQTNAELEQFAYIASHDLQEPLRTVTNYLHLLEKKYKDQLDKDANGYIDFTIDASNKMRSLILGLLEYSRINRIKSFELIDMNLMIPNILKTFDSLIEDDNITIKYDKLPKIYGDHVLIHQLFQHIIDNAIKFRKSKNAEVVISCKQEKNVYQFSVKDNGIGIKKEHYQRIFNIFHQLHNKDKYAGSGMGLPISKKIVERHGGKLWVESEIEKGSTFYFTLKNKIMKHSLV